MVKKPSKKSIKSEVVPYKARTNKVNSAEVDKTKEITIKPKGIFNNIVLSFLNNNSTIDFPQGVILEHFTTPDYVDYIRKSGYYGDITNTRIWNSLNKYLMPLGYVSAYLHNGVKVYGITPKGKKVFK